MSVCLLSFLTKPDVFPVSSLRKKDVFKFSAAGFAPKESWKDQRWAEHVARVSRFRQLGAETQALSTFEIICKRLMMTCDSLMFSAEHQCFWSLLLPKHSASVWKNF